MAFATPGEAHERVETVYRHFDTDVRVRALERHLAASHTGATFAVPVEVVEMAFDQLMRDVEFSVSVDDEELDLLEANYLVLARCLARSMADDWEQFYRRPVGAGDRGRER